MGTGQAIFGQHTLRANIVHVSVHGVLEPVVRISINDGAGLLDSKLHILSCSDAL